MTTSLALAVATASCSPKGRRGEAVHVMPVMSTAAVPAVSVRRALCDHVAVARVTVPVAVAVAASPSMGQVKLTNRSRDSAASRRMGMMRSPYET